MPLARGTIKQAINFDLPVSFKPGETEARMCDALNVFSLAGALKVRPGTSRYNSTSLSGTPLSMSFFKSASGTRKVLCKVGTNLLSVATSGAHTTVKSSLTATTKHRGVTLNNRHIISIEGDGLFSWDGTTFSALGQAAPTGVAAAIAASGGLPDGTYQVGVTFYASSVGFETNISNLVTCVAGTGSNKIVFSSTPTTATNTLIDKKRIYLKSGTGAFYLQQEVALASAPADIIAATVSTDTPPTKNAAPLAGGGKYLTTFNDRLVYAGNATYPNDVFFSEPNLPDAFDDTDTANTLNIPGTVAKAHGDGPINGIATGFYNQQALDPYLVIFKQKSISIYSERDDFPRLVQISDKEGCVSGDTIIVRNGNVYYMSDTGWQVISNGQVVKVKDAPANLGGEDIAPIFRERGYQYEINQQQADTFFSVYYSALDQYITGIKEGSNTNCNKCYVYQYPINGFTVYRWPSDITCACNIEDGNGYEVILLGTANYLLKHSIYETNNDISASNVVQAIPALARLIWFPEQGNLDASCNFRELLIKAVQSQMPLTVKAYLNYNEGTYYSYDYDFSGNESGFILDVSQLDVATFNNSRAVTVSRADINRVGQNILLEFYQEVLGGTLNLVTVQLHYSLNGNRN